MENKLLLHRYWWFLFIIIINSAFLFLILVSLVSRSLRLYVFFFLVSFFFPVSYFLPFNCLEFFFFYFNFCIFLIFVLFCFHLLHVPSRVVCCFSFFLSFFWMDMYEGEKRHTLVVRNLVVAMAMVRKKIGTIYRSNSNINI